MPTIRIWTMAPIIMGLVAAPAWAAQEQTPPPAAQSQPAEATTPVPPPPAPARVFDPSRSDEKAIAIADQVIAASGGEAWAKTRFIKFTWSAQRGDKKTSITHYWDRFEQRSRMEGPSKDGRPVIAIVDHRTRQGQATLGGQLLLEVDAQKYVDLAYTRIINDSYWLLMPFRLKDPGVRLRYEDEIKAGPVTYDKILVTFDEGSDLPSKDRYWLYVNRASHMVERWSYVIEGQGANSSPIAWQWEDWQEISGLKLSLRKTQPGGEMDIVLEGVQLFETLPEAVFTSTAPVDLMTSPAPAPAAVQ